MKEIRIISNASEELNYLNSSNKIENGFNEISQSKRITHLKYRLIKTFVLFLSWISLGLFSEIIGPALPALRIISGTNHEEISRALSSRAAGLLIGSLIGGVLADQFIKFRNLLIFIFLSLAGITVATIPLCQSLLILAFNLFISGFSHGAFTTSGNPSLGALWKEKSTGPFNFMHSGYGLGAAVAPLLIKAFDKSNETSFSNVTFLKDSANSIKVPFLIVGMYCFSIALIFFVYCFLQNPIGDSAPLCRLSHAVDTKPTETNVIIKNKCFLFVQFRQNLVNGLKNLNRKTIIVMFLSFISFFALVGNERVFGKFQFSYAIEGLLKMSKDRAYLINCLYWVSFCLARIFIAVLALKIPAKILLISEIFGALISSIIFTIWNQSELVFFIFSTSFGFFKSPLFPTMLGVLSLYVTVSGILVVVVNFGSAAGAACCQYLAGYLIHNYGHYTFTLTVTGTAAFLFLVFLFVVFITRKWKKI